MTIDDYHIEIIKKMQAITLSQQLIMIVSILFYVMCIAVFINILIFVGAFISTILKKK